MGGMERGRREIYESHVGARDARGMRSGAGGQPIDNFELSAVSLDTHCSTKRALIVFLFFHRSSSRDYSFCLMVIRLDR